KVESFDQYGNFLDTIPALTLDAATLPSSPAVIYSDACSGPSTQITQVTIPSGGHAKEYWLKDTKAETVVTTLSATGLLATDSITFPAGPPAKIALHGVPST